MGPNKYRFLVPGKLPPFVITPELFIFLESAMTLPHTHLRDPLRPRAINFLAPDPHPLHSTRRRPLACGGSAAGTELAGLVLLQQGPQTQALGQGRGRRGSGREMHLLNKRRPGRCSVRVQVPAEEARRLQEAVAARGPARGWGMRPHSGSRLNTATCLRPRRQERKSSLPAAAAAGKTWAGAGPVPGRRRRGRARTQSRCNVICFLAR